MSDEMLSDHGGYEDEFDKLANLCQTHKAEWDRDCEYCVESANLCRKLYEQVVQQVTAREHEMMAQGAMVGPTAIAAVKIEVLVSMMLGNKGRAYFDYLFQSRLANEYKSLLEQLASAKLMEGMGMSPEQIAKNKKDMGL